MEHSTLRLVSVITPLSETILVINLSFYSFIKTGQYFPKSPGKICLLYLHPSHLPRYCATCTTKDLCSNPKHHLPVARVDVGGLELLQHCPTVDVSLTVQHSVPAPVLNIQDDSHLKSVLIIFFMISFLPYVKWFC